MQTISLNSHCAQSFWQVTKPLWNAGRNIHDRERSLSNAPSPGKITTAPSQGSTSKRRGLPNSAAAATWERTLGLSTPGHNYPTLMRMSQHDCSFLNCGTGPPWWQQSINSLDTKYSTFKWSSTWPWWAKTAKTLQHDDPCFIWMHTATSWKSTASLDEHEIIMSNYYSNLCLWKQEELD